MKDGSQVLSFPCTEADCSSWARLQDLPLNFIMYLINFQQSLVIILGLEVQTFFYLFFSAVNTALYDTFRHFIAFPAQSSQHKNPLQLPCITLQAKGKFQPHILRFYICSPIHFIHVFFKTFMKLLQSFNSAISGASPHFQPLKSLSETVPSLFLKPVQGFLPLILASQYSLYSSLDKADKLILMLHKGGQGHIRVA